MIKGILIYDKNRYGKNKWFAESIIAQGRLEGLSIDLILLEDEKDTEGFFKRIKEPEFAWNFCFAIMRIANPKISEYFEARGKIVFNKARVSKIANDKFSTYIFFKYFFQKSIGLEEKKLENPENYHQIKENFDENQSFLIASGGKNPNFMPTWELPNFLTILDREAGTGRRGFFVVKSRTGHGGSQVYKIDGIENLGKFSNSLINKGFKLEDYIVQEMADEVGKDLRIYMLGDRIIASVLRSSDTDFRSNYSLGGKIQIYELDEELEALAKLIQSHLKSDLIGIDFIRNKGRWVLNEIEDVVGLRSIYRLYDFDPVKKYILHIKKKLKDLDKEEKK